MPPILNLRRVFHLMGTTHYSPAKDATIFAGYAFMSAGGFGVDIPIISRYKPPRKRNLNLTPDTYPE